MSVLTVNYEANKAEGKPGPPAGETPAGGEFQTLHEAAIPLSAGVEERAAVTAIFTFYQIAVVELERIKTTAKQETQLHYKTEAERAEFAEGKGGITGVTQQVRAATFSTPFEKTFIERPTEQVGTVLIIKEETTYERSILPVSIVVLTELILPTGVRWSGGQENTVHFTTSSWNGAAEKFGGLLTVSNYADLVNPIRLDPGQEIKSRVRVSVGLPVKSKVFGGVKLPVVAEKPEALTQPDSITLWYGREPPPPTGRGPYL